MAIDLNPLTKLSAKGNTLYIHTDWDKAVIHNDKENRYEFLVCSPDTALFRKACKGRNRIVLCKPNGEEFIVTCVIIHAGGNCQLLMENILGDRQ